MTKVERYKEMFNKGLLSKEQLTKLKDKGIISEAELKEIIGGAK